MENMYGNYFSQKLFKSINFDQRIFLIKLIGKEFFEISCNGNGSHSLQTLVESATTEDEQNYIRSFIEHKINDMVLHPNATHVIQKLILHVDEAKRDYVNDYILTNISYLICDMNGICVVKKFIKSNKTEKIRKFILTFAVKNCIEVSKNCYGNYFIQTIFEEWGIKVAQSLYKTVLASIITLSVHKFSVNVVERLLELLNEVKLFG